MNLEKAHLMTGDIAHIDGLPLGVLGILRAEPSRESFLDPILSADGGLELDRNWTWAELLLQSARH